jgi:hypothetical protein
MTDWDTEIKKYIDEEDPISIEENPENIYIDMSNVSTTTMNSENDYSDLISDIGDTIDISGLLNSSSTTVTLDDTYGTYEPTEHKINRRLEAIEKRLAILEPNPKLLEKYSILQSLHEQYKAAEAMLYEDEEEELPF